MRKQRETFLDEIAMALYLLPMPRLDEATRAWEQSIRLLEGLIAEKPGDGSLRDQLLNRNANRTLAFKKQGRVSVLLDFQEEQVAAMEGRNRQFKDQFADRAGLAFTLYQLSQTQCERMLTERADASLKRAAALQRSVIADQPKEPVHRINLCV